MTKKTSLFITAIIGTVIQFTVTPAFAAEIHDRGMSRDLALRISERIENSRQASPSSGSACNSESSTNPCMKGKNEFGRTDSSRSKQQSKTEKKEESFKN
jgi:hypothetical protein